MNVELLEMERGKAKVMLREYRRELHREHTAEIAAVEQGLAAVARGRRVLHLSRAIESGGLDELGRPHIAVARADRPRVRLYTGYSGSTLRFSTGEWSEQRFGPRPVNETTHVRLQGHQWHRDTAVEWDAMVPLVPPAAIQAARLKTRASLGRYMVLFEVERWMERGRTPRANGDPYLIKHVGGELYEVVAEWDLTPLERAIMQGRR